MTDSQSKFNSFASLHRKEGAFVMPNPWDAGSARILASLGFEALATTSAGYGFSKGLPDAIGGFSRKEILDNAAEIVNATHLPVSADLQNGFGDTPDICAETIRMACDIGLVGGSIEDATGNPDHPIYDMSLAIERIQAAAEAVHGLPFLLTARAENYLFGREDLDDTIKRLQAFSKAGVDVLYAPGLPNLEAIRTVCEAVDKPVNVVMGLKGPTYSVAELSDAGVRRISVGGSLARASLGALMRAAEEIKATGSFSYAPQAPSGAVITRFLADGASAGGNTSHKEVLRDE